jgi:hypothetical protein
MILNSTPQNEAVLSNVGQIGEFRIRNSAKAFSILSSGLYANKVRAIIRELSCNAVDSHAAAGKKNVPFEVHLPNSLEPHFSIRDFGTGLSHDQVTQIYTTYFESTKTASNEFIGALGLGSKSPFAYTDNFTVTAIKDGSKRIYTAFINDTGVPSIALMTDYDTDEENGVEVKFSVNDRYDYSRFTDEARTVYTHFALRPKVLGAHGFEFYNLEYESKDIVPGVHTLRGGGRMSSTAVMGNIAYPINVPAASNAALGGVASLLNCNLEMHFGIGELDFQASREGLSYIPQTIDAIRVKLEALNAALTIVLAKEADAITNLWERAVFLFKKKDHPLWNAAVYKYAVDTKLSTWDSVNHHRLRQWQFKEADLAKDYNIVIKAVGKGRGYSAMQTLKGETQYAPGHAKDANGNYITWQSRTFGVSLDNHFVINDLKTGALERVKHHYRETPMDVYHRNVYVLEKADKTKNMNIKAFFLAIQSPPEKLIFNASTLKQKDRVAGVGKNVTILSLQKRGNSGRRYSQQDDDMVWRDAGKADAFDKTATFYYVPLSGFSMLSTKGYTSGKQMYEDVKSLPGLFNGEIYGVRKADIDDIKKRPNWKNFEEHIAETLKTKDISKFMMSVVKTKLNHATVFELPVQVLSKITATSPYKTVVETFGKVTKFNGSMYNVEHLFKLFAPTTAFSPDVLVAKYQAELHAINKRYPLLNCLTSYRVDADILADYINMVDSVVDKQ